MKNRTKNFFGYFRIVRILPNSKTFKLIENQLEEQLSVGTNYRVVSRAKSKVMILSINSK